MDKIPEMSIFRGKKGEISNDIFNRIPSWVNLNAFGSDDCKFKIYKENIDAVYVAVKTSSLPQDVIEFLTEDGTCSGMLLRAGFGIHTKTIDLKGYADAFHFCECLGKYTKDFLHIIAPFVEAGSYLLVKGLKSDGSIFESHKWMFDGNTCNLVPHYNVVVGKIHE